MQYGDYEKLLSSMGKGKAEGRYDLPVFHSAFLMKN